MHNNLIDDFSGERPPIDPMEISQSDYGNKQHLNAMTENTNKLSNQDNYNNTNDDFRQAIEDQVTNLNQMQVDAQLFKQKMQMINKNQIVPGEDGDYNNEHYNDGDSHIPPTSPELEHNNDQRVYNSRNCYQDNCNYGDRENESTENNQGPHEASRVSQDNNSKLKARYLNLTHSNEQLIKDYISLADKNDRYIVETSLLNKELTKLRLQEENYIQLQNAYEQACDMNTKAHEEKVSLMNDIRNLKDHINQRESSIESMSILLNQNEIRHQKEKDNIEASIQHKIRRDFELQIVELYSILQERDEEIGLLKHELLSTENELLSAQSYARDSELKFNSLSSQLTTQSELNQNIKQDSSQSITELRSHNKELSDVLLKAQDHLSRATKESNIRLMKYNSLKDDFNTLIDRYNTLKANYSDLQAQYQTTDESYSKVDIRYKMINTELNTLKEDSSSKIARISKENNELRIRSEVLANENNILKIDHDKMDASVKISEYEITDLKAKARADKSEYENMRQINMNLEVKVMELTEIIKRLEQNFQKAKEELTSVNSNRPSLTYDKEKLLNERSKIIEELSKEKISNKDKDGQLGNIIKILRDSKTKLMELKEEDFFTYDYIVYLTESTINHDFFENVTKIEDFINKSAREFKSLKVKMNEKTSILSQLTEDKARIQKEYDMLLNEKYSLETKIKGLHNDINSNQKKIKDMTYEYKQLQDKAEGTYNKNDKLTQDNRRRNDAVTSTSTKIDQMNESISFYEIIRTFIEDILLEMSQTCLYNTNIGSLVNDLIKANYDLMQAQRDKVAKYCIESRTQSDKETIAVINTQVNSKFKEIEFLYSNILKELKIEKRLMTHYTFSKTESNLFTEPNSQVSEFSSSNNKSRSLYSQFKTAYKN